MQEAATSSARASLTKQLTPKGLKNREQRIRLLKKLAPSYEWREPFGQFIDQWLNEAQDISADTLKDFVNSHFELLGKEAVELFNDNLSYTATSEPDIVSFVIGQRVARATVSNSFGVGHLISCLNLPAISLGIFSALQDMLTNDREHVLAFAEKFLKWLCLHPAEMCGDEDIKKDCLEAVNFWRKGKRGEIWQLWDCRSGWFGKTSFGESLFAFLCHAEAKELVAKLSIVDLPLTAHAIFSDAVFLADPEFLLETFAKLPCSCDIPSTSSAALPVWNGSVLAPCLLYQLPVCLDNMLASDIDEEIVRTWAENFAKALLTRMDGVYLSFFFTRYVLLDYIASTQAEDTSYRLFLESINAVLTNNDKCRKKYLSFMHVFYQKPSEAELHSVFLNYQQTGKLQNIPECSTLNDLIALLCILPDKEIAAVTKTLVSKYEHIWAINSKDFGYIDFANAFPCYAHQSIASLYYFINPAQSVNEWMKSYKSLVPAAENYFLRTSEDMESVALHQRITFHLAVGVALSDMLVDNAFFIEALKILIRIVNITSQISLYLSHVFVSDYRHIFTQSAVRAYKFAQIKDGDATKGIAAFLQFAAKTNCLPLLALDVVGCLLANEERKAVLTENEDIRAFAKKAWAEAEEYAQHEHWDEQEKCIVQDRCKTQKQFFQHEQNDSVWENPMILDQRQNRLSSMFA